MFGYLKGYFLKEDDFSKEQYKAVYCGACHSLALNLGPMGRLLLSHELVALFSIAKAFSKKDSPEAAFFCPLAGIKKRKRIELEENQARRIINLYLILLDLKIKDNLRDEHGFRHFASSIGKSILARVIPGSDSKDIDFNFPYDDIESLVRKDNQDNFTNLDEAFEKSSIFFSIIGECAAGIIEREDLIDDLKILGESVGRSLSLIDTLDDLRDDVRTGRPNPLVKIHGDSSQRAADIFDRARDDASCLAHEYLCDIAIALQNLPSNPWDELLRGVFGRPLERAFSRHFDLRSRQTGHGEVPA